MWIKSLLQDIGIHLTATPALWCDNIGAIYLALNLVFHVHTKHAEIDFHFVRDLVVDKTLQIRFISSKDQLADVLAKPIVATCFQFICHKFNVHASPLHLKRDV
jgi:hypothetical protein